MIFLKYSIEDKKIFWHNILSCFVRPIGIFLIVFSLFIAYMFYYKYVKLPDTTNSEGISIFIYILLGMLIVFLLSFINSIFQYKKYIYNLFNKINDYGFIEFSIYYEDGELVIENISRKTMKRLGIYDITRVVVAKNSVFIIPTYEQMIMLPKTDELIEFFKKYNVLMNKAN